MVRGEVIFVEVLSQSPARPEPVPLRFKVDSVVPVDPSGRMASSAEVNVCPSSEMVHFALAVTFPLRLTVKSQLFGPVDLIVHTLPYLVVCSLPSSVSVSAS